MFKPWPKIPRVENINYTPIDFEEIREHYKQIDSRIN